MEVYAREWQSGLVESVPEPVAAAPAPPAPKVDEAYIIAACTAAVVFALLVILKPPFVETGTKERPYEPARTMWPMIFILSAIAGLSVLLFKE